MIVVVGKVRFACVSSSKSQSYAPVIGPSKFLVRFGISEQNNIWSSKVAKRCLL